MARVLFTVCGIGMGHAARSSVIIKELMKEHEVLVVSYGDGYNFLKEQFDVTQINWFRLIYDKDQYKPITTIFYNIPRAPFVFASNFLKLFKISEKFKPDIVVSDFDINGLYVAGLLNIPTITISNMHLMEYERLFANINEKIDYYLTQRPVIKAFDSSNHTIVVSIVKPKAKSKNVYFFYPLLRQEILKAKPKDKGYFLVYNSETQLGGIIPILRKFPKQKFVVRGKKLPDEKNISFKPMFSDKEFTRDLSNCSGVFCHGGLSLISEAVILKKPVFVFTPKEFSERYYNGKLVEKLGFGLLEEKPSVQGISSFISSLPKFKENLAKSKITAENSKIVRKVKSLIKLELRGREK